MATKGTKGTKQTTTTMTGEAAVKVLEAIAETPRAMTSEEAEFQAAMDDTYGTPRGSDQAEENETMQIEQAYNEADDVAMTTTNGHAHAGMSDKERLQALRAERKAQRAAQIAADKALAAEIRALAPLASRTPAKTVEQVDAAQNTAYQVYIVRSIAGRVQERLRVGQSLDDAMAAVLDKMTEWSYAEVARRERERDAKMAAKLAEAE